MRRAREQREPHAGGVHVAAPAREQHPRDLVIHLPGIAGATELADGRYLRETGQKKRVKAAPSKPMEFRSSSGLTILVGRNNRENDLLTTKLSSKGDLWLHTQKIHGSHVILACSGMEPDDQSVTEAAQLAAWFSQARDGQNIPVDVTAVKNVKKPAGAKPGMVVYYTYRTVYVTPDAPPL